MEGTVGTRGSLTLRLGQAFFSLASLLFMSTDVEFYSYTAFCFLVTVMGLVIPWSSTLAFVDAYSIFTGRTFRLPEIMVIILLGDWMVLQVLSMLSLAGACAAAGVVDVLQVYNHGPPRICGRYKLSYTTTFVSWFLTTVSSLSNLWSIASL